MMSFKGKNILVIGGSSGIGFSLINLLLHNGASVYNISRTAHPDWQGKVNHLSQDVLGDLSHVSAFLPEKLHGLVYSVGSITLKPFSRLTEEDFLNDYRINVLSCAKIIQLALKSLKASQGASIVLLSSVAVKVGMSFHSSIAGAKAAVEGMAISLAAEFAPYQISVNVVAPSLTDTPLAQTLLSTPERKESSNKRHPLGRYGSPNDISAAISFLLSDNSNWITGQILGIDGGLGKLKSN